MHEFQSQDTTKLAKALIAVQRQLHPAIKDSTNPFTKSRYASLNSVMDACRTALLDAGIWLTQYPVPATAGYLGLVTKLTHSESGQWQGSLAVVPLAKDDPQGMGISMTYIRRYALSAMLGIVTEDDTGGEIRSTASRQSTRTTQTPQQRTSRTSPQRPSTPAATKPDTSVPLDTDELAALPELQGMVYNRVETDGKLYITATGNTLPHKDTLAEAGFRWNAQRKFWWLLEAA